MFDAATGLMRSNNIHAIIIRPDLCQLVRDLLHNSLNRGLDHRLSRMLCSRSGSGNFELTQMGTFQGTVQELGMSIFMQGSHQLLDDKGGQVALLEAASDAVDLNAYVGQKVKVEGQSSPSVEGSATMVKVESISKL